MGWDSRLELPLKVPQTFVLPLHQSQHMARPQGLEPRFLLGRSQLPFPLGDGRIWNAQRDLNSYLKFRRFLCFPLHHERILRPPASPHWCAPSTVITTPYASQIILRLRAGGIEGNWTLITSMANWSTHHCTTTPYGGPSETWTHNLSLKRRLLSQLSYRPKLWWVWPDLNRQLSH